MKEPPAIPTLHDAGIDKKLSSRAQKLGSNEEPNSSPTLADAGIDKKLSSRAQKLAADAGVLGFETDRTARMLMSVSNRKPASDLDEDSALALSRLMACSEAAKERPRNADGTMAASDRTQCAATGLHSKAGSTASATTTPVRRGKTVTPQIVGCLFRIAKQAAPPRLRPAVRVAALPQVPEYAIITA